MTWEAAKEACENLVYGGYDDWYLPTSFELKHIMENCNNGWICTTYTNYQIPTYRSEYWSSDYASDSWRIECYISFSSRGSQICTVNDTIDFNILNNNGIEYIVYTYNELPSKTHRVRPVRKYLANQ